MVEQTSKSKYRAMLIFGPPGIGKGTQSKKLGQLNGFLHFSTGDMFRALKNDPKMKDSEIGKKVTEIIDAGHLVPDRLTVDLFFKTMEEYIEQKKYSPAEHILLLDGIPRNSAQVSMLRDKVDVIKIIYLFSSDDSVLAERIEKRAISEGRKDDTAEVLKKRLETYRKETTEVLNKYPKESIIEVDGFGTIDNIYEEIIDKLEAEKLIK